MDQQNTNPGGTPSGGLGGPANTPTFSDDATVGATATDHQIPSRTSAASDRPSTGGAENIGGQIRNKTQDRLNDGLRTAADRLESAAENIDGIAEDRLDDAGGRRARAGELAHTFADSLDSLADYLRDNDIQSLQRNLERQVRERPLQTILVGVAAGWVVGKILR